MYAGFFFSPAVESIHSKVSQILGGAERRCDATHKEGPGTTQPLARILRGGIL